MKASLTTFAFVWTTILAAAPPADPAELEQRMLALQQSHEKQMSDQDWDGATGILREMAALDPEHPKIYLQTLLMQDRRGKRDETPALMDSLGLPHGPGRIYGEGLASLFRKRLDDGFRGFSKALPQYRARGHLAGQAACHFGLGYIAKDPTVLNLNEAIRQYDAARAILKKLRDVKGLDDVLQATATIAASQQMHALALQRYRESLTVREKLGDRAGQARTWQGIGTSLSAIGDRKAALAAFDRALEIRREINDPKSEISTLESIADMHAASADLDKAMQALAEALRVAEGIPDALSRAEVLRIQGEVLLAAGHNRDAVEPLDAAASAYKDLKDVRDEAIALGKLGLALNRVGEFGRARDVLEKALELARASKNPSTEAAALTDLGNTLLATGEPARALVTQEQSLALYQSRKDVGGELKALNNLYATYFAMGILDRSRSYILLALKGYERIHDRAGIARSRSNLGVLLAEENRPAEGLAQIRQAISIRRGLKDPHGTAISCSSAAEMLVRLGKPNDALQLLQEALGHARKIDDRGAEAYALNILGQTQLALRKADDALGSHRGALAIADASGLAEERWHAHAGIASVLEAQGQRDAALEESLRAIDEVEKIRKGLIVGEFKMRYLAGKIGLYESALARLIPAKIDRPDPTVVARSFQLAERATARSLLDLLAESRSGLRAKVPQALQVKEREMLDELSAASVQLAEAENDAARNAARERVDAARTKVESLEIDIHRDAPRYGTLLYPRPISIADVQRFLAEDEVLLEYFMGARRSWLWVIDTKSAALHELGSPSEIARQVPTFLGQAAAAGASTPVAAGGADPAARLSSLILPRGAIPTAKRILVVADGPLRSLPFESLRHDGRYLVERQEVVMVPSAAVIGLMRGDPAPVAEERFLGVGAPVTSGAKSADASLPYAREELTTVGQMFPEESRTLLIGPQATKPAFKALSLDRFRYIHLATHGWIDEDPRYSGLKLSPAAQGDPSDLLSMDEIVSLPLASAMVVLSSCRSGAGEQLAGEGTVGLARAFLYAGSRSALVSLWDVGDRSTAVFMSGFYAKLLRGESAPEALRNQKLEFLKSDREARRRIHAWAPFVLVGDPGEGMRGSNQAAAAATH